MKQKKKLLKFNNLYLIRQINDENLKMVLLIISNLRDAML